MKKILLILLLSPLFSYAQYIEDNPNVPIDSVSKKVDYTALIKVDSLTKDEIYSCAREWFHQSFSIGHCELVMDDYAAGHLIAKGTIFGKRESGIGPGAAGYTIAFLVDLWVTDKKYRYEITDFHILAGIDGNLLPDWMLIEKFALGKDYKNKQGLYTGKAKQYLGVLDGNMQYMISDLKASIHDKLYAHKIKPVF